MFGAAPEAIELLDGQDPRNPRQCRRVVQPALYLILCHSAEQSSRHGSCCSAPVSATEESQARSTPTWISWALSVRTTTGPWKRGRAEAKR